MITEPRAERFSFRGGFPVYPSRYVIVGGGDRHVALRFFNAGEVGVTGVRFLLSEYSESGELLAERTVDREGAIGGCGEEFPVADVPVDYDCASVKVTVQAVFSGPYEYLFEEGGVRLRYGHTPKERESDISFAPRPEYTVSKKRKKYVALAFLAVFGFAAVAGAIAWRFGFFDQTERASRAEVSIVRSVSDVEAQ